MKITGTKKFLLALLLTGCLTVAGIAHAAADRIEVKSGETYKDETTGSETITDTFDGLSGENGGAINNAGTITSITGTLSKDPQGNVTSTSSFTNNTASNNGGAIYNSGTIGEISDSNFTSNGADTAVVGGGGGAIYNSGTITSIKGTTFELNTSNQYGGAIYNDSNSKITEISDCTFKDNSGYLGGAIYNNSGASIGSIKSSTFESNSAKTSSGGAIYNYGSITEISDCTFTSNTSEYEGGAICNTETIGTISDSTFTENKATGTNGDGGAIRNTGTIETIENTSFTYNFATYDGGAIDNFYGTISTISDCTFTSNTSEYGGGAIYNSGTISTISNTTFTSNTTYTSYNTDRNGGAIYNHKNYPTTGDTPTIGEISDCSFSKNSAGNGGAIYNDGTITTIKNTSFTGNTASSDGGAIYNSGTMTLENCTFSGNTASSSGGVIYNSGTANINYSGQDAVISGNTANGSANFLYGTASSVTNFNLSDGASLLISDGIAGETGYSVNVKGDSTDTTFYMYDDFSGSNLSFSTTTLNTINNEIHEYKVNSFTVAGNFNMAVDVDLSSGTMDRITATDYGTAGGTLTVSSMNVLSDATSETVAIYFADPGLMKSVSSGTSDLPDKTQTKVYTPIYTYGVRYAYKNTDNAETNPGEVYYDGQYYEPTDDSVISTSDEAGGYFVFDKTGYNPAVMASSIATMGAYNAMGLMFEYNFEHSDYYMKLPEDVRLALAEDQKNAKNAPKENDATRPEYYNRHELTYRGAWFKSFFSNESVSYRNGWGSRDKYYGAIVGFDTDMKVHRNGWATVTTGYAGALGITQDYSGGHIKQTGGFLGLTESFYKKNFYTAWTIAAGTTKAHEHTMYGKDSDRIDDYGIAARFGWNIDMDYNGKFALLPTFTASYSYIHPEDFTNAADVRITGSGFRAVQLNPNLKLIWKMNNGWQPYLSVGEVWTVGESTHLRADQYKLDEIELRPYTEYGIGVQKRWANEKDAYVQVLGHSHGRDGILVGAGIRWNF